MWFRSSFAISAICVVSLKAYLKKWLFKTLPKEVLTRCHPFVIVIVVHYTSSSRLNEAKREANEKTNELKNHQREQQRVRARSTRHPLDFSVAVNAFSRIVLISDRMMLRKSFSTVAISCNTLREYEPFQILWRHLHVYIYVYMDVLAGKSFLFWCWWCCSKVKTCPEYVMNWSFILIRLFLHPFRVYCVVGAQSIVSISRVAISWALRTKLCTFGTVWYFTSLQWR